MTDSPMTEETKSPPANPEDLYEPVGTQPVVGDRTVWYSTPDRVRTITHISKDGVIGGEDEDGKPIRLLTNTYYFNSHHWRILKRKPTDTRSPLRVYLAGPMTGLPDFNFPAFNEAEAELLKHYQTVFNPAKNFGGKTGLPRADYMRKDFEALLKSDVIALLPGWAKSKGARAELVVAEQLGLKAIVMPIADHLFEAGDLAEVGRPVDEAGKLTGDSFSTPSSNETILQEAQRLVGGDRGADYGHPLDDYTKTGTLWGVMLHKWAKVAAASDLPTPVPADLCCLMMVGVKISRHLNKRKRDNLVDAAGYLRCVEMCEDESARRLAEKETDRE